MSDLIAIPAHVGFARIKTRVASGNCGVHEPRIGNSREGEARAALGGAHAQAGRVLVRIADDLAAVRDRQSVSYAPGKFTVAIFLDKRPPARQYWADDFGVATRVSLVGGPTVALNVLILRPLLTPNRKLTVETCCVAQRLSPHAGPMLLGARM